MNVCTSSEMLAILLSAKNTCSDVVHKWQLGLTFFPKAKLTFFKLCSGIIKFLYHYHGIYLSE